MTRTLAAVLALSAGLTAAPALAQPYGQPNQDRGYQAPPGDQDRSSQDRSSQDRSDQDRSDQDRGYQDRGYQAPPPNADRSGPPDYVDSRTYTSRTHPDRVEGDSKPERDPREIDPAPGARGPYVGVGPQKFYDVDDRISRMGSRMAALPASQRKRAYAEFRAIQAEERTQRAKHGGELRDWDREHLNRRLDALEHRYSWLAR